MGWTTTEDSDAELAEFIAQAIEEEDAVGFRFQSGAAVGSTDGSTRSTSTTASSRS